MAMSLVITWVSLGVAFYSVYPVGFFVSTIGFAIYVLAAGGRALSTWLGTRSPRSRGVVDSADRADGADLADSAVGA
jgi:hypothetical protein